MSNINKFNKKNSNSPKKYIEDLTVEEKLRKITWIQATKTFKQSSQNF